MKEGNRPYSIAYRIAYALSNTHHSDLFLRKEYIEIPRIFKEFAKVMAPDPIRITRIGGVDIVIKDHPVLDRTLSSRTEFCSKMSFSEDRIMGYKGKEKELLNALTPQEIRVLRREKAFNRIMPINFRSKHGDFDAKLTHPKMQDKRKFGKVLLSFRQQGLIDSDSFYEESGKEIKNLKEALNKIDATLKEHIVEKIRNFSDVLKDKKHLQSFLGVVNFAGIFIKDLTKYRKDFRPLLKETESAKWKWEEIHTQTVRELKQICNNLPKLVIPRDEDELVVYTDANDYRWAAVLMKKTTTGEEPCRYTGGLFTDNKPKYGTSTRKSSLRFGRLFLRNDLYIYLLKNSL
ncbi:UNVERIFIED_CONTAM: Polyprotein P3 [Sesamum calycinum]|uniref:Polyprotein P3 n=1 Tax=Sesamum calycinum TaxID=2727403 RepID=A0AAW2SHW0_9LAMI